jgi:uncharacterized protein YkwD
MLRTFGCALAVLLVGSACSSGPQKVGAQPSWRSPTTTAVATVFEPQTQSVQQYNGPITAVPSSALGDATVAMVNKVSKNSNRAAPTADARLFEACAELASIVPENGVVSYNVVEFAMQRHGIIEPSPHLLVVWGDIDDPATVIAQLEPRIPEILASGSTSRVGVGAAKRKPDGTGAVVFAMQASNVRTSPMPRALPKGGVIRVEGSVAAQFREPEVFVTSPEGQTERIALLGDASSFSASVECGSRRGKLQIEITGSDRNGSTVLANFPVWCHDSPPTAIAVELDSDEDAAGTPDVAAKQLLTMINRDRRRAGLPELQWHDQVAKVALGHSIEMHSTKVVAHISPTTGSAADRIRVANIRTGAVLENVARAYGVREAHDGLMNSPGHRANLMSTLATHVGIGIVFGEEISGRREIFVTQVFIRIPPKIDLASSATQIFDKLAAVRPVKHEGVLERSAQLLAEKLASGQTREQAWPSVKRDLEQLGSKYRRVGSVVTVVTEIDGVEGATLLGDYRPTDAGVGVAQGTHADLGEHAIWVVLLLAEAR